MEIIIPSISWQCGIAGVRAARGAAVLQLTISHGQSHVLEIGHPISSRVGLESGFFGDFSGLAPGFFGDFTSSAFTFNFALYILHR
jgi:hypothetical protein